MSKETTVIALGVLTVIIPFLGFPESWRVALLVLSGVALAIIGFVMRGEAVANEAPTTLNHLYAENAERRMPADIGPAEE